LSIESYGDAVVLAIVGVGVGAGLRREGAELDMARNGAALQAEG